MRAERRPSHDAKMGQLCRQAEQRLALALAELDDEWLCDLSVEGVEPGPGGELVVLLGLPDEMGPEDVPTLFERLAAARGRLRAEVAEAIHRKRTPQLVFTIAPRQPPEDE